MSNPNNHWRGDGVERRPKTAIISFGIACCAITMVVVLAVAIAAAG